jgi:hypothetical protein
MGGSGSGSWYRWSTKTTTGEMLAVDIRWLNKRGYLKPGHYGLQWTRGDEPAGDIRIEVYDDYIMLVYRSRKSSSDEWESIRDRVCLTQTPCHYGGSRVWFRCPSCGRRVAVIYGGRYFRCRHCYKLAYSCQNESTYDRLNRKARKIRRRLGASEDLSMPIVFKPKGMHQKTFVHLLKEADHAEEQAYEAILLSMARFMKMGPNIIDW